MTIRLPKLVLVGFVLACVLGAALVGGVAIGRADSPQPSTIYAQGVQHLYLYTNDTDDVQTIHVTSDHRLYRCLVFTHDDGYGGKVAPTCDWNHPIPR